MRIRFWGTRGSIAKPGPSTLRYGGNTSCVEVRTADGTLIVLDCGTGAHGLGKALAASNEGSQGHLLMSHMHWDHIQGFPFFAPLHIPSSKWDVYGPRGVGSSLRETLAGQMNYTYFPVDLVGLNARVHYQELVEGAFELGDVRVEARYLNHPAVTLGYRLEADGVVVVYATDHEPHSRQRALGERTPVLAREDDAHSAFLEGADLVIHDTQYTAEEYPNHVGWGHSTVEYVVDSTSDKGIRRLALFHHDPMRDDAGIDRLVNVAKERLSRASEPMDVFGAVEGMTLDVEPRPRRSHARQHGQSARQVPERDAREQTVILASREPANLRAFRDAASADNLVLHEASCFDEVVALATETSPSLVVFEPTIFGQNIDKAAQLVRDATDGDGTPLSIVALIGRTESATVDSTIGSGVDEWVETPLTVEYARTRLRSWLLRTGCRWRRAPLPPEEETRIRTLHELNIVNTPAEDRFDRYTRIAAALFRVPTAFISFVDIDRQWFKSRHGLDAEEMPRDQAFCAHAILSPEVFQVTDARVHPDFADYPVVSGPPYLRFYAGVPLTVKERSRVGTLCLIDYYPRKLDSKEIAILKDLGRLVEKELEADTVHCEN